MSKFEITWLEDRSDESLLHELRRVASLTPGVRLTKVTFDTHARISTSTVERRFKSWTEATRKAGLSDALPTYTDVDLILDL